MYCQQCGNLLERNCNFCKHCGQALHPNTNNLTRRTKLSDNGFLLIALLNLLPNIFFLSSKFLRSDTSSAIPFDLIEVSFLAVLIAQFVLLVLFTKNNSYRIIIIVIGILCLLLPVLRLLTTYSEVNGTYTPG